MSVEWNDEEVLSLIENYKEHPVLWNPSDINHFNKNKKRGAWNDIAGTTSRSVDECKRKMVSLLASFRREKMKIKTCTRNRKGSTKPYASRWFAFEAMQFLEERVFSRETNAVGEEGNTSNASAAPSAERDHQNQDDGNKEFAKPTALKRKRQEEDPNALLASAVRILRSSAIRLNSPTDNCEVKGFCNYLSSKMLTYSQATKRAIQHCMFDILMKADRGHFDISWGTSQFQTAPSNFPPHNQYAPIYVQTPTITQTWSAQSQSRAPASSENQQHPTEHLMLHMNDFASGTEVDQKGGGEVSPFVVSSTPSPSYSQLSESDSLHDYV